jgi:hypothetical protein
MERLTHQRSWMRWILTLLLACVLCATVVAVSHIHPPGETSRESHCSLCMVGAVMVAIVGSVLLVFRSIRFTIASVLEPKLLTQTSICVYFIRPPPQTFCFF